MAAKNVQYDIPVNKISSWSKYVNFMGNGHVYFFVQSPCPDRNGSRKDSIKYPIKIFH